ncbi:putative 2-phosphosulfolactate phosphatase [Paractinoplanes abujensis]|uniref:Probable 2-phosphosulfolactate phosphatase n=1 Tax=Paractinoplanes abujensis TaxID=882441 RepID=A0A7W7G2K3_9ACTN|nr:2-phosphosulfolactate phosphatase [Actinoplanes abujensis]MBB4693759.1 2-phosphosulfolactate phosphatase [Actinoplanes abujensis]GID21583.1 putative 2-phosphosulfolactate phosphatase [Actinoplanes abujensis]
MSIVGMDAEIPAGRVVVVIDVIRAFTTAALALERGAAEIACAATAEAGRELRGRHPDRLLIGEVGGLKPPDFDLGNSPADMAAAHVDGRRLIQATSNGTRGLARCPQPAALLAAAAVNVAATARWIKANHPGHPWTVLCTGRTAEDWACARHLSQLLDGAAPDRADLIAGIRQGAAEHARKSLRYPPPERVDLTPDLPLCCDVDRAGFAMVGEIRPDHVVVRAA